MERWGGSEASEALRSPVRRGHPRGYASEISYTVRLSDLVWMYLGSQAARIAAAPGSVCLVLVVIGWPSAGIPVTTGLEFLGVCLAFTALGPLMFLLAALSMYGARGLVGTTVHLSVDDKGVRGWPLLPDADRTWPRIGRVREMRGVITMPFRKFGTRAGWVPVPRRAMTADHLTELLGFLATKGVL
jgi:hypothetical protein